MILSISRKAPAFAFSAIKGDNKHPFQGLNPLTTGVE
jgi:hypothetical protein